MAGNANDHERVARALFDGIYAVDLETIIATMHPDIVWEVPGRSPVAGRHVGLDAVGAMMLGISEMAPGPVVTSLREIFANQDGVLALVDVDITPTSGQPWHGDDAWLVRTDGSQVTFVREHWFDTHGFDEMTAWNVAP